MADNPYTPPTVVDTAASGAGLGPEPPEKISVSAALRFAFTDVGFLNLLVGLLVMVIPFIGSVVLMGWHAGSMRRLARREAPAVQSFTFSSFVDYLMAGLVPFVAQMALTVLAMIPFVFVMAFLVGAGVAAGQSGGDAGVLLLMVLVLLSSLAFTFAVSVVVIPLQIRAELTGSFEDTFKPSLVWEHVVRAWKTIFLSTLLLGLAAIPLMLMGMLVFFVGMYVVAVAIQFAFLHLRWQLYEHDLREGATPLIIHPGIGAKL